MFNATMYSNFHSYTHNLWKHLQKSQNSNGSFPQTKLMYFKSDTINSRNEKKNTYKPNWFKQKENFLLSWFLLRVITSNLLFIVFEKDKLRLKERRRKKYWSIGLKKGFSLNFFSLKIFIKHFIVLMSF